MCPWCVHITFPSSVTYCQGVLRDAADGAPFRCRLLRKIRKGWGSNIHQKPGAAEQAWNLKNFHGNSIQQIEALDAQHLQAEAKKVQIVRKLWSKFTLASLRSRGMLLKGSEIPYDELAFITNAPECMVLPESKGPKDKEMLHNL